MTVKAECVLMPYVQRTSTIVSVVGNMRGRRKGPCLGRSNCQKKMLGNRF